MATASVQSGVAGGTVSGGIHPDNMADLQNKQIVVDRLKRRLGTYRTNHSSINNHFQATVDNLYSTEHKNTLLLKQRLIEQKAKKNQKKSKISIKFS